MPGSQPRTDQSGMADLVKAIYRSRGRDFPKYRQHQAYTSGRQNWATTDEGARHGVPPGMGRTAPSSTRPGWAAAPWAPGTAATTRPGAEVRYLHYHETTGDGAAQAGKALLRPAASRPPGLVSRRFIPVLGDRQWLGQAGCGDYRCLRLAEARSRCRVLGGTLSARRCR